jgi:hypothetical protein
LNRYVRRHPGDDAVLSGLGPRSASEAGIAWQSTQAIEDLHGVRALMWTPFTIVLCAPARRSVGSIDAERRRPAFGRRRGGAPASTQHSAVPGWSALW